MPELPEVETFRRQIEPYLIGQKINDLHVYPSGLRMIIPQNPLLFRDSIVHKYIEKITRRGKFLILELEQGMSILIHLRMSGRLLISNGIIDNNHKRLELELNSGKRLNFIDIRRFGTFHLLNRSRLDNLGPDLLTDNYELEGLMNKIRKRNIAVHKLLLDQTFLAGAGNIYANEALFKSQISPFRSASSLTKDELKSLIQELKKIIAKAVSFKGTTLIDKSYKDSLGEDGEFAKLLNVYGRKGVKCPVCSHLLEHSKLSGRSVYFCPNCQN